MLGKVSYKILKLYVKYEVSYIYTSKVEKLDACKRPLFANSVTSDKPDVLSSAILYLFADDTKCLRMHSNTASPQSIKPYYKMISMHCLIMVTLGNCSSIILSVHTCISKYTYSYLLHQ